MADVFISYKREERAKAVVVLWTRPPSTANGWWAEGLEC